MREGQLTFQHPQNTDAGDRASAPAAAVSFCFTGTSDSSAINGQIGTDPKHAASPRPARNRTGLPFISVSGGFNIGNNWEGELPQVGNSFQWSDNLTWVKGNHTSSSAWTSAAPASTRPTIQRQRRTSPSTARYQCDRAVRWLTTYPGLSPGAGRHLSAGIGATRGCSQHRCLSVRAGQLEDSSRT